MFVTYKDLFECPCPKLHPSLPFRTLARAQIIADFHIFQPIKNTPIVYVADGPGGLLFDFILINQLIESGYAVSHIIIIEPLQQLEPIRRAQEQFVEYFNQIPVYVTIFQTWDQYAARVAQNPELRGTCLITIDPDSPRDLPDPENRHKNYHWHQKIKLMHQPFFWAALYQQELPTNSNRHLFTGTGTITIQKNIFIAARHRQGFSQLDQEYLHQWLNHRALLPSDLSERVVLQETGLLPVLESEQVDQLAQQLQEPDPDRSR